MMWSERDGERDVGGGTSQHALPVVRWPSRSELSRGGHVPMSWAVGCRLGSRLPLRGERRGP